MSEEREFARRLEAALDDSRRDPVDAARLLDGARAGARRIVRRRRQAAGAVVAVAVAAGVGTGWWLLPGDGELVPAQPTVAASTAASPSGTPAAAPAPVVDPATLAPDELAFALPTQLWPPQAALPAGLPASVADAPYRSRPVVSGQMCDPPHPGTEPISAAAQSWSRNMTSVDVVVTGYSRGKGAAAFAEAQDDTGQCRWLERGTTAPLSSALGQEAFSHTESDRAQVVVRVGDLLVGAQAFSTGADADVAARAAEQVAQYLVDQRVQGSAG